MYVGMHECVYQGLMSIRILVWKIYGINFGPVYLWLVLSFLKSPLVEIHLKTRAEWDGRVTPYFFFLQEHSVILYTDSGLGFWFVILHDLLFVYLYELLFCLYAHLACQPLILAFLLQPCTKCYPPKECNIQENSG